MSTARRLPVLVVVSLFLLPGCRGAGAPPADDVWAVVDGHEIRRADVELAYRRVTQPGQATPSDAEALTLQLEILDQLIDQELMLARARARTIEVTDAEVETAYGERKRNMTDEAFQTELDQRQLTIDDMKGGLRRELVVQKLIDQEITAKIAVSDQEIRDFYEKNRAQFNVAEAQYRLAQIVVTPVKEPLIRNRMNHDAASPAEAKQKMQMLADRLRAGADFTELAMDYSEDPQSGPQGGDLGFVPASALDQAPPQLKEVVLKTEPGNVSSVSAGGAYTIVLVVSREAAGQRELSTPAVRDGINTLLRQRREQLLRTAYVTAARDEADIVNHLAQRIVAAQGTVPVGLAPSAPGK